jgi:hypothetical protein
MQEANKASFIAQALKQSHVAVPHQNFPSGDIRSQLVLKSSFGGEQEMGSLISDTCYAHPVVEGFSQGGGLGVRFAS